ncbi:hypothetical protein Q1695_002724 [Nippostrongylus brasiliensis]|nr:hypothetical protein Q1695_002724 [Nippostrongylus brasiliensis]
MHRQLIGLQECVVCRRPGCHFSDACPWVTQVEDRRRIIRERCRFQRCLEHCKRGSRPRYRKASIGLMQTA